MSKINRVEIKYTPTILNQRKVTSSENAYQVVKQLWDDDWYRESFGVLHLNRANQIINFHLTAKGGVHGTVTCSKMIFSGAIAALANSIILVHNHPSGALQPSSADINITKSLSKAGKVLGIPVLDHLIITPENYLSMADKGYNYF
jgi:DNA repair protein RadC